MNKLEVGMYCRTDKGYIFKINEYIEHYTKGKRLYLKDKVDENFLLIGIKQCEIIESIDCSIPPCYPSDEELEKIKEHIVKTSFNLIDIVQEGDYVNGFEVEFVAKKNKTIICYTATFEEEDIKSIVTKEQFEAMKYEVE